MTEIEGVEIVERRTEESKTYHLGGKSFRLITRSVCHWKYDYSDPDEQWKDVDLSTFDEVYVLVDYATPWTFGTIIG